MTRPLFPNVAVLLACFNGDPFIQDQISTIQHQTGVKTQIFIRDDGSTDKTAEIVNTLASIEAGISVVDPGGPNTGSAALNFLKIMCLADFGDADYVALADQDDLWLPQKLQRAICQLKKSGSSGYSCNLAAFDNSGLKAPWVISKHHPQKQFDHLFQGGSAGCTYVLTRECADALRQWLMGIELPVDLAISHDWLIYAFVRDRALGWCNDGVAMILYRQHNKNVYGSRRGLGESIAQIRLLRNRWYRRHVIWLSGLLDLSREGQVLRKRIERFSLLDRLWLIALAGRFRRRALDVMKLRLALLTDMF